MEKATRWRSWVNGAETLLHGTHVRGFEDTLVATGWQPTVALIHVVMQGPQYAAPTKDQLGLPHVREVVASALAEPLAAYCQAHQFGRWHVGWKPPPR